MSRTPVTCFSAQRFRSLRLDRGLSYAKLARATGLTPATFSHWEAGRYVPSQGALALALLALNAPIETVLDIPPGGFTLTDLRVRANMSPGDVAQTLNLSMSGYSALERGELPLTQSRIDTLSSLFDTSPEEVEHAWERAH